MKVLITGASGFVGARLLATLRDTAEVSVRAAVRNPNAICHADCVVIQGLSAGTNWEQALRDIDVVVNLAARVHVMNENAADPLAAFRAVNVEGALALAAQAARAGAKRFVQVSTVKVNGEWTAPGQPFTAEGEPAPQDPYAVSKLEAEIGLREISAATGMEYVIVRPPLVYGPGVKANFEAMMRWITRGVPLPLASIHNQRSLIALDNLVDFISTCLRHPAAANQVFVVSDGEDLSTPGLLRRLGEALGTPARLFPVPQGVLELVAAMVGKRSVAERLCGSLQIDSRKARQQLAWNPPLSIEQGLRRTASYFIEHKLKSRAS